MKKFKTYLVALLLGITAFCLAAINVQAADSNEAGTASQFAIECDPDSASKTEATKCYILAKVTTGGVYAVTGEITTLKDLVIVGENSDSGSKGVYSSIGGTNKVVGEFVNYGADSVGTDAAGKKFKCKGQKGCVDFISVGTGRNITESKDNVSGMKNTKHETDYLGFTNIGWVQVKIAQEEEDSACGEICIHFSYQGPATVTEVSGGSGSDPKPACDEVNKKSIGSNEKTTETGSFASYAVLAAGAFIAISAIAIAKKHNKFYRV